jgi:hypothetical protein
MIGIVRNTMELAKTNNFFGGNQSLTYLLALIHKEHRLFS